MHRGESGPDVAALNASLLLLDLRGANGEKLKPGDTYGADTEAAVMEAQRRLGLKPTGRAGSGLMRRLADATKLSPCTRAKESTVAGPRPGAALRLIRATERWNAAQHPRGPHGLFRNVVDRLRHALTSHRGGMSLDDPFNGFSRDELMQAYRSRGLHQIVPMKRGAHREEYVDALIADLAPPGTDVIYTRPGIGVAPGMPTAGERVYRNGFLVGAVYPNGSGGFFSVPPGGTRGSSRPTKDMAINELIHAHNQAQTSSNAVATVARLKKIQPGPGAVEAHDVRLAGTHIGAIEKSSSTGSWFSKDINGMTVGGPFTRRKDAVDAVVQAHATPPVPAARPATAGPNVTKTTLPGGDIAVAVNGVDVGMIIYHPRVKMWDAVRTPSSRGAGPLSSRHATSAAALDALVSAYATVQAPAATSPAGGNSVDPLVQAAQDILYGTDPKAKTAARQLAVYGLLRRTQFDTLSPAEQSTLLGDLSYIAATSQGPNKGKAVKLIDRFTPPGTPSGTVPTPSAQLVGPANGTQTRLPQPKADLLKQAKNSGIRGDAWVRPASGTGGRVWGTYGSGGLLLRHVDAQGVERFLMTQRGPAISDPGKWSYPGGAFESLESPFQGATREVAEELGWTDADFAGSQVHGYHTFERPDILIDARQGGGKVPWSYTSVAADVPTMVTPNLSTGHARAETSDAKWLTRAEIADLDRRGMLHAPVAGGKLEQNVMALFPSGVAPAAASGRPDRLTGTPSVPPRPAAAHKPSRGKNLIGTKADQDKLRADIKATRKRYRGKSADERLSAIGALQGYDETPTVVGRGEFDRLLATGDYIEAWRGVKGAWLDSGGKKSAAQVAEEMRSGPSYYGRGIFGNGFYLATDRSVALGYTDGTQNSLIRILIPKDAKTEQFDILHRKVKSASSSTPYSYQSSGGGSGQGTLHDEGRYAAAAGLDGIENPHTARAAGTHTNTHAARPGLPTYTWVNRSVLIIEEAQ
jgi:8-oxo-dGTP pyrophosphatase MutT (NUDIX family)